MYTPVETLKAITNDVWVADDPAIRFGFIWPKMPFPTRATIVRLAGGALFVHSPIAPSLQLRHQIEGVGTPQWIVGPSRFYYRWIPNLRTAYPQADIYLPPRIRVQAGSHIARKAYFQESKDRFAPWNRRHSCGVY